jgi:Gluconate 2-dehydrogenase subunit 3
VGEKSTVTRRKFLKRAAQVGTAVGSVAVIGGGKVMLDLYTRASEVGRRGQERPLDGQHWFTPEEYTLVDVLAALIVPSDEAGPGAHEANVVVTLDRLLATSDHRQGLYAPGLLAFDELALDNHGHLFVALTSERQIDVLRTVDRRHREWSRATFLMDMLDRAAERLYYKWDGLAPAVLLFPMLVNDVLQAFYTSQVAWDWLGYDGPPMPRGYLGLLTGCS